jgi:hypothetical protein
MESASFDQPQKSSSKLPIIIGVVVAVLCCCCVVVIAALMMLGPAVGNVFSSIESDLNSPGIPDLGDGDLPIDPNEVIPGIDQYMAIPEGGYGDETLRMNTWAQVMITAALAGCESPNGAGSWIEVTIDMNSAGEWQERWNVDCGSGVTKAILVDYTPDGTGNGYTINMTEE